MKKIIYILIGLVFFNCTSCTDNFEETNKDPNELTDASIDDVFPGTVYKTLSYTAEMNYNFTLGYSRYTALPLIPSDKVDMSGYFRNFYVNILKDMKIMEDKYAGNPDYNNRYHILMTWKAYVYSLLASSWGAVPMSEAIKDDGTESYNYDSELKIYEACLTLLKDAVDNFDPTDTDDALSVDPIYQLSSKKSDIERWRKFANTIRLDIALRIQNISDASQLSEEHVKDAMEHEDWLISSVDDIAKGKWGKDVNSDVSYYYTRFLKNHQISPNYNTYPRLNQYFYTYLKAYNDPRISSYADRSNMNYFTVKDTLTRVTPTNALTRDSILVQYTIPYFPGRETMTTPPTGWIIGIDPESPGGTGAYQSPYVNVTSDEAYAYVNVNFIKMDAEKVFYSWADACFLKAEAKIKYNAGQKSADTYYSDGIDASFLQYGYSLTQATTYKSQNGVKWNTNGKGMRDYLGFYRSAINGQGGDQNHLEQIYKQKYIAGFFNGIEAWILERRTRALSYPPIFYNGGVINEGSNGVCDFTPERLLYSEKEISDNKQAYYKAVANIQEVSPSPSPVRWGDNFYTGLHFSKKDTRNIDNWLAGEIVYNFDFVRKYYGRTEEEFVTGARFYFSDVQSVSDLSKYINYKVTSVLKTYTP